MQKLEAIKEARAAGAKRQAEEVDAAAAAAAAAIADPEVERPVIQLSKKRRVRAVLRCHGVPCALSMCEAAVAWLGHAGPRRLLQGCCCRLWERRLLSHPCSYRPARCDPH